MLEGIVSLSRATKFLQLLLAMSSLPSSYHRPWTQHSIMNCILVTCSYIAISVVRRYHSPQSGAKYIGN